MNRSCPTEAKLPTHCDSWQSRARHFVTTSRARSTLFGAIKWKHNKAP